MSLNRKQFLKHMAGWGAALAASGCAPRNLQNGDDLALRFFKPTHIDNPLAAYPNRDWESVYRNIFQADETFTFLCAPNDTHNCLLKTYVKNGIAVRIGPTYGYRKHRKTPSL